MDPGARICRRSARALKRRGVGFAPGRRSDYSVDMRGTMRPALTFSLVLLFGLLSGGSLGAEEAAHGVEAGHDLEHRMTVLALQIGVILFAGYAGTRLAKRLKLPLILG